MCYVAVIHASSQCAALGQPSLNVPSRPSSDTWHLQHLQHTSLSFITDEQILCSVSAGLTDSVFSSSRIRVFLQQFYMRTQWIRADVGIQYMCVTHAPLVQLELRQISIMVFRNVWKCLGMCSGGKWVRNSRLLCITRNTTATNWLNSNSGGGNISAWLTDIFQQEELK